jgi:hypothetical protein
MGWMTIKSGVWFQVGKAFPFSEASRPAVGPTQPPTQYVPVDVFLGVKVAEARHKPVMPTYC